MNIIVRSIWVIVWTKAPLVEQVFFLDKPKAGGWGSVNFLPGSKTWKCGNRALVIVLQSRHFSRLWDAFKYCVFEAPKLVSTKTLLLKHYYPKDPFVLKIERRVNFGTGSKFGTDVAKRNGEGSEVLVFSRKKRQENGMDTERLRWWQNSMDSSAVPFLVRKGPLLRFGVFREGVFQKMPALEGQFLKEISVRFAGENHLRTQKNTKQSSAQRFLNDPFPKTPFFSCWVFEAPKLVSTKTLLLKHYYPPGSKEDEKVSRGVSQKTREGCGCFRGLYGTSVGDRDRGGQICEN